MRAGAPPAEGSPAKHRELKILPTVAQELMLGVFAGEGWRFSSSWCTSAAHSMHEAGIGTSKRVSSHLVRRLVLGVRGRGARDGLRAGGGARALLPRRGLDGVRGVVRAGVCGPCRGEVLLGGGPRPQVEVERGDLARRRDARGAVGGRALLQLCNAAPLRAQKSA